MVVVVVCFVVGLLGCVCGVFCGGCFFVVWWGWSLKLNGLWNLSLELVS